MSYVNVRTGTSELCQCLDIDITHVVPDINKVHVTMSQEFDTGRVPAIVIEHTSSDAPTKKYRRSRGLNAHMMYRSALAQAAQADADRYLMCFPGP